MQVGWMNLIGRNEAHGKDELCAPRGVSGGEEGDVAAVAAGEDAAEGETDADALHGIVGESGVGCLVVEAVEFFSLLTKFEEVGGGAWGEAEAPVADLYLRCRVGGGNGYSGRDEGTGILDGGGDGVFG